MATTYKVDRKHEGAVMKQDCKHENKKKLAKIDATERSICLDCGERFQEPDLVLACQPEVVDGNDLQMPEVPPPR